MGLAAPLKIFIDGIPTDKSHSQVANTDYELDYVPNYDDKGNATSVGIYAFSNRGDRIAWGKERGYPIKASYEFVDAVHQYIGAHNLPEDPDELTQAETDAYQAFESELYARFFPRPVIAARGSGFLSRECQPNGGGLLQLLTTKPFL